MLADPMLSFVQPRVAAGVLFLDDQSRVLMVVPTYKDYYDIPGGYVEHGETPHVAAQREVAEELGIRPEIGRLLVADWWRDSPDVGGSPKLLLIFDGGTLAPEQQDSISVDGDEIEGFSYEPLGGLDDVTIPRLANRLRRAAEALDAGLVAYLENGDWPRN